MFDTKELLLEALMKSLPYAEQICNLDFTSEKNDITFEWRRSKFRVSISGSVNQLNDNMICGTNESMLIKQLLHKHKYPSS